MDLSSNDNHRGAVVNDPVDEVALNSEEVKSVAGKFGASLDALGPVTARDSTGAISVTLDKDGRISAIVVSPRWKDHYTAASLVSGITEAQTTAGTDRFEQFGQRFADDEVEPVRMPAPLLRETLAGQLAEIAQSGDTPATAATMEHIESILLELTESIDVVSTQVEAMQARTFTSQSPSGHARATLAGSGTLIELTLDKTWLERAHPTNVGREATQAIQGAYRKMADQDVSTIIGNSVIGKLDRLSRDPVALAREFGLRD